jgi:Putative Flp pilus-assembly TadE/G-like
VRFYSRVLRRTKANGQVLVIVAIGLVVLLAFAALATDVGLLYVNRRQMQTAADAAAIAGSNALLSSQSSSYQSAAQEVATLNGFTSGQDNVTVTVGAPANPPNPTTGQYVQATITRNVPVYFLSVLGYSTIQESVQAVAGTVNSPNCIYALDTSATNAINMSGSNISLDASCGLVDSSSSSTALNTSGSSGTITTTSTGVAGNYSNGGSSLTFSPTPKTGIAPVPDPLASVSAPTVGTCTQAASTNGGKDSVSGSGGNVTLSSAVYAGGISIGGIINTLTFGSGTYGDGISFNGAIVTTADFNSGQYQNGGGSGASINFQGGIITNANFVAGSGSYTFCGPLSFGNSSLTATLQPGLYVGGISITNSNANVTFNPGTYILAGGGLTVTGNATIQGTGVTFYNTSSTSFAYAPIDISGNVTANLSAPTSGSLAGILFFQDRSVANTPANASTIAGNSSNTFNGVLYFPTTGLTFNGNSSTNGYTFLITDTLTMTGNVSASLGDNYSSLSNGSPVKSTTLYE